RELAIALNEFKLSLRSRQEGAPPLEASSGTGLEVTPPLAALAAVPMVNRPAAPVVPPAGPPRSPITPSIPIPATVVAAHGRPTRSCPQSAPEGQAGPASGGARRPTGSFPQITPEPPVDPATGAPVPAPGGAARRPAGWVPLVPPGESPAPGAGTPSR